jgi:hypothetical protein
MKTKKIEKKLILKKETIAILRKSEMNVAKGGRTIDDTLCANKTCGHEC